MAAPDIRVFGIRHHGPGSARSLMGALQLFAPDCIAVELPADAAGALKALEKDPPEPPVAILFYNPDDLHQAAYYPFAEFSPEWQAFRYGIANRIPFFPVDLPVNVQFALDRKSQLTLNLTPEETALQADPLGMMAQLAGYPDSERWWDVMFERGPNEEAVFPSILEMVAALRDDPVRTETRETLLREAYMRKCIRDLIKQGHQRIAVVCGAWHGPVLARTEKIKAAADNAVLKGLPKRKTEAVWIPWSYRHLSRESGYGAGVSAPAWYELLFQNNEEATVRWMARVAALLRKEGFDASPAQTQDATRLADTLATLRNLVIPGLEELEEAARSVFGRGENAVLALIREKLVIGERTGMVPAGLAKVPLQKDLEQTIKSTRMTKYWGADEAQWLKGTATNPKGGIDLREPTDLDKSRLLHRLNILEINWGSLEENPETTLGGFKEIWRMQWAPDFALSIIEAGIWGNTLEKAATARLQHLAGKSSNLSELAKMASDALRAGLPDVLTPLIRRMEEISALSHDIFTLLESLPSLIGVIQYGDARKTDVTALAELVNELAPRMCAGLPAALAGLDEESAQNWRKAVGAANRALSIQAYEHHMPVWLRALELAASAGSTAPLIAGQATRILFDKQKWSLERTNQQMRLALSAGRSDAIAVAGWVEGFMEGSGLVLIHHPPLWALLDEWVSGIGGESFQSALPVVRRTFSQFTPRERQQMLVMARQPQVIAEVVPEKAEEAILFTEEEEMLMITARRILGMG
ncbi:MAG: hypothetical protein H6562_03350 [Lewinellaceae bacterium]|nr:hypothetical protein [Lewinellaceae bacterium]